MKALVAMMFAVVIACAALSGPELAAFARGLFAPSVPAGSAKFLLGVMGGVGGSVTLLCYGYWIREKGWRGTEAHRWSLLDLTVAYALTGVFGLAVIVIAAGVAATPASGSALVLALGDRLGEMVGPWGRFSFLIGFWAAVATSLLGVWQGVPYLFADYVRTMRLREPADLGVSPVESDLRASATYRGFLVFLAFPPLSLLFLERPIAVVVAYAVTGAFFMPFLAGVLLVMNNRRGWVGVLKNPPLLNALLGLSLALFGVLFVTEVVDTIMR